MSNVEDKKELDDELLLLDASELFLVRKIDGTDYTFVKPGRYISKGKERVTQVGVRIATSRGEVVVSLKSLLLLSHELSKIVDGKSLDGELHEWVSDIYVYERAHAILDVPEVPEVKHE